MNSELRLFHGQELLVNDEARLGSCVTLRHNTPIGNKVEGGTSPAIGSNIDIGANSVVSVKDFAVGNPARPIHKQGQPM